MRYAITIKREALKELKLLPKDIVIHISSAIESLADDPRPNGCKKLKGSKSDLWRIRVGNYRVVYLIDDVIYVINVQAIGHREDVYK